MKRDRALLVCLMHGLAARPKSASEAIPDAGNLVLLLLASVVSIAPLAPDDCTAHIIRCRLHNYFSLIP